jgi:hypothetical protein
MLYVSQHYRLHWLVTGIALLSYLYGIRSIMILHIYIYIYIYVYCVCIIFKTNYLVIEHNCMELSQIFFDTWDSPIPLLMLN